MDGKFGNPLALLDVGFLRTSCNTKSEGLPRATGTEDQHWVQTPTKFEIHCQRTLLFGKKITAKFTVGPHAPEKCISLAWVQPLSSNPRT